MQSKPNRSIEWYLFFSAYVCVQFPVKSFLSSYNIPSRHRCDMYGCIERRRERERENNNLMYTYKSGKKREREKTDRGYKRKRRSTRTIELFQLFSRIS